MLLAMAGATSGGGAAAVLFAVLPSMNTWWIAWGLDLLRSAAILPGFLLAFLASGTSQRRAWRGQGWRCWRASGWCCSWRNFFCSGVNRPGYPISRSRPTSSGFASQLALAVFRSWFSRGAVLIGALPRGPVASPPAAARHCGCPSVRSGAVHRCRCCSACSSRICGRHAASPRRHGATDVITLQRPATGRSSFRYRAADDRVDGAAGAGRLSGA